MRLLGKTPDQKCKTCLSHFNLLKPYFDWQNTRLSDVKLVPVLTALASEDKDTDIKLEICVGRLQTSKALDNLDAQLYYLDSPKVY